MGNYMYIYTWYILGIKVFQNNMFFKKTFEMDDNRPPLQSATVIEKFIWKRKGCSAFFNFSNLIFFSTFVVDEYFFRPHRRAYDGCWLESKQTTNVSWNLVTELKKFFQSTFFYGQEIKKYAINCHQFQPFFSVRWKLDTGYYLRFLTLKAS